MTKLFTRSVSTAVLAVCMAVPATSYADELTVKVNGRIMIDWTLADLDTPDSNINATELRRGRIQVSGKYGDNVSYKVEFNKASGDAINIEDAYLQFKPGGGKFKVTVGQDNTPNSLDELTSSRFSSTIERAAFTDAFSFDRRVGVILGTSGDNYTIDAGIFTTNLEEDGGTEEGHAYSGRVTYNPVKTDETVAHVGASVRHRVNGDTSSDFRYRQRPYTHVATSRIINTGRFADSDTFIGVEAAVIHNQLWAAGEYASMSADGTGTNADGDFSGFYAEVGMFVGGKKTYKGGKFNRPKVDNPVTEGGTGAFSVVARYDQLDLQDGPYLGELDTIILGADWWPTKNTRMSVNYFNSDAENGTAESAEGIVGRLYFDF